MRQQLLVVAAHSTAAAVTNSSSELLICDQQLKFKVCKQLLNTWRKEFALLHGCKKSLKDMVKPVIQARWHLPRHHFWTSFRYLAGYDNSQKPNDSCADDLHWSHMRDIEVFDQCLAAEKEAIGGGKLARPAHCHDRSVKEKEASALVKEHLNQLASIWRPWRGRVQAALDRCLNYYAKLNGLDLFWANKYIALQMNEYAASDTGRAHNLYPVHPQDLDTHGLEYRKDPKNGALEDFFGYFHDVYWHGAHFNKGDILIYSAGDNTIPEEIIEKFCALGAVRHHLG